MAMRIDWKDQIGDQKLKGMNQSERQFAMRSRDAQPLYEQTPNVEAWTRYIQRAANQ